jgi:hypothetical protein
MKAIRQVGCQKRGLLTSPRVGAFIQANRESEHAISITRIHIGEDELHSCQQIPVSLQYKEPDCALQYILDNTLTADGVRYQAFHIGDNMFFFPGCKGMFAATKSALQKLMRESSFRFILLLILIHALV